MLSVSRILELWAVWSSASPLSTDEFRVFVVFFTLGEALYSCTVLQFCLSVLRMWLWFEDVSSKNIDDFHVWEMLARGLVVVIVCREWRGLVLFIFFYSRSCDELWTLYSLKWKNTYIPDSHCWFSKCIKLQLVNFGGHLGVDSELF